MISLPDRYADRLEEIRERLGLPSQSEVIRRAIDLYADILGIDFDQSPEKQE
jgi:metal-responsive CopG/Arc/MetJ family transcriptional regulator